MLFPRQVCFQTDSPHCPSGVESQANAPLPSAHLADFERHNPTFQALFKTIADGLLIVDQEGFSLAANPTACELLGLTEQDLITHKLADFIPPEFNFAQAWHDFLSTGQASGNFKLINSKGEQKAVEYTATAHFLPQVHLLTLREFTPRDDSGDLLRKIARHIPGVIYQFDQYPDGHFAFPFASEGMWDIYGVSPEAVREDATPVLQLLHPDDVVQVSASIQESAETLEEWHCEYRICHPDGRILWVVGHATPQRGHDGTITWFGYIRDITAAKGIESALRESEARTRALLEGIPDMMIRCDRQRVFLDFKPSSQVASLMRPEEFLGKTVHDILPPPVAQQTGEAIERALDTQEIQEFEYELPTPAGVCSYEARLVVCGEDEVFCIIRDITERKEAECQLQAVLSRSQLLNQISTEIRNSLDLDTILKNAVNAIFGELNVDICVFGWYRHDLEPPCWEIVQEQRHPDLGSWLGMYQMSDFPQLYRQLLNKEIYYADISQSEDQILKAFCEDAGIALYFALPVHMGNRQGAFEIGRINNDCLWQEHEVKLLESIGNQVAIAIYQAQLYQESQAKTQELEKAYHELQQTQIQLIQAEKMSSLGQLVAGVAHEINNPVNFIYGNLTHTSDYIHDLFELIQLYQSVYPEYHPQIEEFMEEIQLDFVINDFPKTIESMKNGALRIRDIVKSLRTFSRVDEAEYKTVNLHDNLDSTLTILQNRLHHQGHLHYIEVFKNYGNLPNITCYSGLLNQVFMNLLVNALDSIEERQKKSLSADHYVGNITIKTQPIAPDWVSITIKDNGMGIPLEVQQKMFNPFFSTKPVGKGTGMGLAISYQIVTQNHQGHLHFSSTPGVGSEFVIELPVV
ncbi:PAS domain S-box protein [Spirulina subsalsa FACHB-351]|uniref:histidine kinase n=1 Tax=Spirulina subsalsa FACHB-351 TaxID=234711 RepID=A0ABT3L3C5_9CYAN|nr:PAS domain S-box protein [Spirulina subsalsa]MCW6036006.1 PAS domain S-box protein [Spirulina subsalsa FACHB-351]